MFFRDVNHDAMGFYNANGIFCKHDDGFQIMLVEFEAKPIQPWCLFFHQVYVGIVTLVALVVNVACNCPCISSVVWMILHGGCYNFGSGQWFVSLEILCHLLYVVDKLWIGFLVNANKFLPSTFLVVLSLNVGIYIALVKLNGQTIWIHLGTNSPW